MTSTIALQWVPCWVSHMGCIKGGTDYLGIELSDAWLCGGTGHAFVLNVHDDLCPSGPPAWNTSLLHQLGNGLGFHISGVVEHKGEEGFAAAQRRAFELVRSSIDQGLPCFGWELEIPEYYVDYAYDEVGYYFSGPGCEEGQGPKPWQELGDSGIGMLEMYGLGTAQAMEDPQVVKLALMFALEHSIDESKWVPADYHAGLAGYDAWIASLESARADTVGAGYNSVV